jgi:hypothetical protein
MDDLNLTLHYTVRNSLISKVTPARPKPSPAMDPKMLTLLRLTPLISTTASLTHAYLEYITTSSFLTAAPTTSTLSRSMLGSYEPTPSPGKDAKQELERAKEIAAPAWFVSFINTAVYSVIGLNSITLISASVNLWAYSEGIETSRAYYLTGLVAAAAHCAFIPLVAPSIERLFKLCAVQEKGESVGEGRSTVKSVREWNGMHKMRVGSVDLVAWVSFAIGVVGVDTGIDTMRKDRYGAT